MNDILLQKETIQKTILAKLLARENITVEIENQSTATFNTKYRILTIPNYKHGLTDNVYNMFIGHEVSHALNTPHDGWVKIAEIKGINHIIQIVEDSRIEKLIKQEYPGIKKYFYSGWREVFAAKRFGVETIEEANKLPFIDRYNIFFKLGESFGIKFDEEEMVFVEKGKLLTTWDDTVDFAQEMKIYIKSKKNKPKKSTENNGGSDDGLSDPISNDEEDEEDDNSSEDEETTPITEENLEEYKKSLLQSNANKILNLSVVNQNLKYNVVTYKSVLKEAKIKNKIQITSLIHYNIFSKPYIDYMIHQFNLAKNAAELQMISYNKTGNLDLNRVHEYMMTDDLFVRNMVEKQGKSHGLVMFLDWSGSMMKNIRSSLYQCYFMTDFCRRLDISFAVYTFTDSNYPNSREPAPVYNSLTLHNCGLVKILCNEMTNNEYISMKQLLLSIGEKERSIKLLNFGGTPLCEAIISAMDIVPKFKEINKLTNVNVVFITDGEGASNHSYWKLTYDHINFEDEQIYLHDRKTNYSVKYEGKKMQYYLFDMLKNRINIDIIGFFLAGKWAFDESIIEYKENKKAIINDQCITVPNQKGYDQYHIINNDLINITSNKKYKIDNRIKFMLVKFIQIITKERF